MIESGVRSDMIRGLKLVNEIFSMCTLNKDKNFELYGEVMRVLCDKFVKGAYCLLRLSEMEEENIRYDAFDALFSLLNYE